tara:strand:+ start:15598 stop:15750 length:153 start_codon:yes stop_codon:yes gene_type:complete
MKNNEKYQLIGAYVVSGMIALKSVLPQITKMQGKKQHNKILQGKWQIKSK